MIKSTFKVIAMLCVTSPFCAANAATIDWSKICDKESDINYYNITEKPAPKGCIYLQRGDGTALPDNELVRAINTAALQHYRLIIVPKKNENNDPYVVSEKIIVPKYPRINDDKLGNVSIVGEHFRELESTENDSTDGWLSRTDTEKDSKLVKITFNGSGGYLFDSESKENDDRNYNNKAFVLKGFRLTNDVCNGEKCGVLRYRGNFSAIEYNQFDAPNGECINHHIFADSEASEHVSEGVNSRIMNNDLNCTYAMKSNAPICQEDQSNYRICNKPTDTFFTGNKVTCHAIANEEYSCIKLFGWSGSLVKNNDFAMNLSSCNDSTEFFSAKNEFGTQIVDNTFSYNQGCPKTYSALQSEHVGACSAVGSEPKTTSIAYFEHGGVHKITGNSFIGSIRPNVRLYGFVQIHLSDTNVCKTGKLVKGQ